MNTMVVSVDTLPRCSSAKTEKNCKSKVPTFRQSEGEKKEVGGVKATPAPELLAFWTSVHRPVF
jgi:hypothetical protein